MPRLKPGDRMPNFTFNTAYEQGRTVQDILGGKPTFFVVLRYIGCPSCRYDVHMLSKRYQEFIEKSAQVLVVMQSSPESIREDLKEAGLPFDIICDEQLEIYRSLAIEPAASMAELAPEEIMPQLMKKGEEAKALGFEHGRYEGIEEQLPALFLVDDSGVVRYAHYAKNLLDMPSVDQMLKML